MVDDARQVDAVADDSARRLDGEAVRRTLGGDTAAYDRLIEGYQRRAVAVSYRLLGNIEDAMDVCQDAFLKAFRSLGTLQEPERFGAWLMRIVTNLSLNFRRGRRANLSLTTDDDGATMDERAASLSPHGRTSASDSLESAETQQAVSAAIATLPEQQRLALVLFAVEGLPQKEVAEILQCSVEMVKWNVFQARKKLREALDEYLEE